MIMKKGDIAVIEYEDARDIADTLGPSIYKWVIGYKTNGEVVADIIYSALQEGMEGNIYTNNNRRN